METLLGCVFLMKVVAISQFEDSPKDMMVFKCENDLKCIVEGKQVAYIDKIRDSELYIYGEMK